MGGKSSGVMRIAISYLVAKLKRDEKANHWEMMEVGSSVSRSLALIFMIINWLSLLLFSAFLLQG